MNEERIRRQQELRRKNKKNNKGKELIALIFTALIVLSIAVLTYAYYLTTPVDKKDNQKITVEVKESYGASIISDILYEKGVIKSPTLFKIYSKLGAGGSFYVGNFEVSKNMNMSEVITVLTTKEKAGSGKMLPVIEGENIRAIAKKVAANTKISEEAFIAKTNDADFINRLKQKFPNLITDDLDNPNIKYKLEGYLYPAQYNIDQTNDSNVELLLEQMLKTTNDRVVPLFEKTNKNWNIGGRDVVITIHDYITFASVLEKESTANADNSKIAGVFFNRLAISMPLQTDPTVYYSADRQQSSGPITIQELQGKDLYNTYVHQGLPPGPIAAPSVASYNAMDSLEKHEFLYFLHAKDGQAYFAKTYAEHQELARKYIEGYITLG